LNDDELRSFGSFFRFRNRKGPLRETLRQEVVSFLAFWSYRADADKLPFAGILPTVGSHKSSFVHRFNKHAARSLPPLQAAR